MPPVVRRGGLGRKRLVEAGAVDAGFLPVKGPASK
jgi:hypothetical protein